MPLNATSYPLNGSALSVNISVALRGPMVVGLKAVETVHVPLAATLEVHVVAILWKSPGFLPPIVMLRPMGLDSPLDSLTNFGALWTPPTASRSQAPSA